MQVLGTKGLSPFPPTFEELVITKIFFKYCTGLFPSERTSVSLWITLLESSAFLTKEHANLLSRTPEKEILLSEQDLGLPISAKYLQGVAINGQMSLSLEASLGQTAIR